MMRKEIILNVSQKKMLLKVKKWIHMRYYETAACKGVRDE
jgi:hypothetical protein